MAADQTRLAYTVYPVTGSRPPAILFVHGLGSDRRVWRALASRTQQLGFLSLAVDVRGHGDSTRQGATTLDYRTLPADAWRDALQDIAAVKRAAIALGADPENIAVVGAGLGANMALRYSAQDPDLAAVVLISPSAADHGFRAEDDIVVNGLRPVMLVCGEDDSTSASACATLKQRAPGFCELRSYPGSARGTDLLDSSPNAVEQIAQWLVPILRSSKPAAPGQDGRQ